MGKEIDIVVEDDCYYVTIISKQENEFVIYDSQP